MKLSIRITALIMAVCMMCGLFAGCGSNGDSSDVGDAQVSGGSTSSSGKLFDEPVTFTWFTTEHALQPINVDAVKWNAITEKTNVTIDVDFAQGTAAKTKLMAASASGKMYDIIYTNFDSLVTYKPDLFIDLTGVMEEKMPNYYARVKGDPNMDTIKIDGKILGMANINNTAGAEANPYMAVIRYDILESNNLSIPTTWEEWYTTMKRLKALYPNSYPVSGRYWLWILKHMENQLGEVSTFHYDNDTNQYTCGVLGDRYKTVLQFMNNCFNEGLIDPQWQSATDANWNELVLADKTFFWIDNGTFAYSQTTQLRASNKNAKMWFMPLMTNLFGEKEGYKISTTSWSNLYCLSSACENKEALYKFMDWCYTDEGSFVNSLGKEGETYTVDNGEPSVPESIWSKYSSSSQPYYSYASELGLGQLSFAPMYVSSQVYWDGYVDMEEELGWKSSDIYREDMDAGNYKEWVQLYPYIGSSLESRADTIESYIYGEVKKFINGQRPISEYDSFVADVKKMGAQDIVDAYNAALK